MTKGSDNAFPSILLTEGAPPSAPAAGKQRLWTNASNLNMITAAGAMRVVGGGSGLTDQGTFTFMDAAEGAAPGTPASGYARIYAKTDGRIYSKSDGGVEYGPFDAGGTTLSDFRLSGVRDDPASIPLGTYGNEFEYTTNAALNTAGWTAAGSLTDYTVCGSSIIMTIGATAGRGLYLDAGGNFPDNFEFAALISRAGDNGNMTGIGILDTNGDGIGAFPYNDNQSYLANITAYAYVSAITACAPLTNAQSQAPHWLAIRRATATTWRFRWSADGTTWTTLAAGSTKTVTNARRIYLGCFWNGGSDYVSPMFHRLVYGTADLGL